MLRKTNKNRIQESPAASWFVNSPPFSYSTVPIKQFTCEMFKTGVFVSIPFHCTRPDLFKVCCWNQHQKKKTYIQNPIKIKGKKQGKHAVLFLHSVQYQKSNDIFCLCIKQHLDLNTLATFYFQFTSAKASQEL